MPKVKVQLNTSRAPGVGVGETQTHYGVPFTVVNEGTEKAPKLVLIAELEEAEAKAMAEVDRVVILEKEKAAPTAPAAK